MKKPISAFMVAAVMTTAAVPTKSFALPPVPPVMMPVPLSGGGGGAGTGAGVAAGIIGVAAFFVFYDIGRRTTCSGDFLQLGGPGFSTPITAATGNVLIPKECVKKHRTVLHAKG
jgi:hypothetical protein